MSESARGCGYRKIGGFYLVCDPGIQLICDGLPLPLEPCGCCGYVPRQNENIQPIHADWISQAEEKKHRDPKIPEVHSCNCIDMCPICYPATQTAQGNRFGLMFVGSSYYTPETFIQEAINMGISKRIPEIPRWLKLGETWILLAHKEVPKVSLKELQENGLHMAEPETFQAIFYAFKPQRVEMPLWKGEITDKQILELEKHGITPVLLDKTPENVRRHKSAPDWGKKLDRFLKGNLEELKE